jgi:hypothetical protein
MAIYIVSCSGKNLAVFDSVDKAHDFCMENKPVHRIDRTNIEPPKEFYIEMFYLNEKSELCEDSWIL